MRNRGHGVRGVHFELCIPLRLPLAPPAPLPPTRSPAPFPFHDADSVRVLRLSELAELGSSSFSVRATVLVVDDSDANRRLLRRYLLQMGCTVVDAADGDEVLGALDERAAAGRPVDIVLMDIVMGRMGGLEAVRAMREAGWALPVVAVTGSADADDAAECERGCAAACSLGALVFT